MLDARADRPGAVGVTVGAGGVGVLATRLVGRSGMIAGGASAEPRLSREPRGGGGTDADLSCGTGLTDRGANREKLLSSGVTGVAGVAS